MSTLQVDLVAADRMIWSGTASMVRARSVSGELGVLPGHTPTLVVLAPGEVAISGADGDQGYSGEIESGFLSVEHDRVTIITPREAPAGADGE